MADAAAAAAANGVALLPAHSGPLIFLSAEQAPVCARLAAAAGPGTAAAAAELAALQLPCWVSARLIGRVLGYSDEGVTAAVASLGGGESYVWATEFENVHSLWRYDEPQLVIDGMPYNGCGDRSKRRGGGKGTSEEYYHSQKPDPWDGALWKTQREAVMEKAVRAKLDADPSLATLLLATGSRPLLSLKPDEVWGFHPGTRRGENLLAKIWMRLREELQQQARADLHLPDSMSVLALSLSDVLGCDAETAAAAAASLPPAAQALALSQLSEDMQLTIMGIISAKAASARAADSEPADVILARPTRGIFSYGTLRADFDPAGGGDRWGVLRAAQADFGAETGTCAWRRGKVGGFGLFQSPSLDYPFAVRGGGDDKGTVLGTLLTWPDNDQAFAAALQQCNAIEGYRPGGGNGLYRRTTVSVQLCADGAMEGGVGGGGGGGGGAGGGGVEVVEAYMYFQDDKTAEEMAAATAFPNGDWLAGREDEAEVVAASSASVASAPEIGSGSAPAAMLDSLLNNPDREQRMLVFSYGSNGTAQLRARVKNPQLRALGARVDGYVRTFCLRSGGWEGGSVANLSPCSPPGGAAAGGAAGGAAAGMSAGGCAFGSVVALTSVELERLDAFEGGYSQEQVCVAVRDGDGREVAAVAIVYIADRPTYTVLPSEAYLCAIHVHVSKRVGADGRLNGDGRMTNKGVRV